MKYLQKLFSILLITGMVIGFIQPAAVRATTLESSPDKASAEKIETELLNQLESGPADLLIVLKEQADVSGAYQLQTKVEKGQYVFDRLVETATRTQADLRAYLESQRVTYQSFYIMNAILVKQGNLELAQEIALFPEVAEINANHSFQMDEPMINPAAPNVPSAVEPNISFIKADQVWAMGFSGQGTVMAGNDTGLSWNHPALIKQYRGCANPPDCTTIDHNFNWWDATGTYPMVPTDGHGHGTHTTGTMVGDDGGANQIGMAPGARTVHCKNMTDTGNGNDGTFLTCFQWDLAPWDLSGNNPTPALAPDAINNSWGYSGGNNNVFRTAIQNLHAAGIVVEVSAGNEGASCASLRSPGDYIEVFTTGSINHASAWPGTMTGFSSRGPSDLDGNYFPDFTAPGENIRSSVPGGSYEGGWSGTSMAGPHVTALIGLIWSANPSLIGQIQTTYDIIQQTSAPVTSYVGTCGGDYVTGPNNDWGYGTIDALAAVNMAISYGGAGTLQGTVTDAVTTAPIAGVTVQAVRQSGGSWSGTTNSSGFYQLAVAAGTFDITASHENYIAQTANNVVVIEDGTTVQDFALQPRGHLFGYVTDQDSGVPLAGTVSVAGGPSTSTDPTTGFYEFYLDPGTYDVTASAPDYADETFSVTLAIGSQVQQDFTLLAAIAVVPDPIAITLEMGQTGTVASQMTNNMAVDYPFMFIELPGGLGTEGSGGPDPFGYTYVDSNEPGGARFEWIDATDGTALNLTDDGEANLTLPFTFNFYGVDSTAIRIGNNGGLIFNATTGELSTANANLGTTATNNLIVPFWDDIDADTGNVYWKILGSAPNRMLVVEWFDRPHYSNSPGHTTFELILYEGSNNIKYQYLDVDFQNPSYDWGASATAGIRGFLPNYLQYSYNQPVIENNMAICFTYPGSPPCDGGDVSWFSTSIMSGTVPANGTIGWTNVLSATTGAGIGQPGVYNAFLRVVPTVLGQPSKMVGVEMTVLPSAAFGQIAGTVTSDRPGGPLEASILIEATGGVTVSLPTDPLTGYYNYWLEAGSYLVTASSANYVSETATVSIVGQQTTTQDFELAFNAPEIIVSPTSLSHTLAFGQTGSEVLTLTNDGLQPLNWELRELNAGEVLVNDILLMADDVVTADWDKYRASLAAAGVSWDEWNLDVLPFPTPADLAPYSLMILADESSFLPGDADVQIIVDWLNSGGKSLFMTSIDLLWDFENGAPGAGEHNLYLMFNTTYQGTAAGTAVTLLNGVAGDPIGGDFVEPNGLALSGNADSSGDYAALSSVAPMGLIYGPGGLGTGYGGLSHYEGPNYRTVWLGVNFHNGLSNPLQRDQLMENILIFLGGAGDIPWLSTSPITGTLQPGASVNVDVMFDSTMVSEPGVYEAVLQAASNDPLNNRVNVPVTMNVTPSADIGLLEGTVTSDRPGGPLGADVMIESTGGMTWTVPTDPLSGYYYKWLNAGLYTLTASADGYHSQEVDVTVTALMTTTQDFELVLIAPEISVAPTSLTEALSMGETSTQTLNISNLGNVPLTFDIAERNGDFFPAIEGEDILVVRHDTAAADAMQNALAILGYTYLGVTDAQFQAMTVDQLLQYMAVFHAGTTGTGSTPGASELLLTAYLDAGGSLYISDNDLGYYRDPGVFYNTYLQAIYNVDNGGSIIDGLDIMAGLTVDITPDPFPDGISVGAEGTAIFQFQGSADFAGTYVDRMGYRAIYTSFDFDDIVDPAQEVEIISRVLGNIAVSDIPWLFLEPISGTVGAGSTTPVIVTFDAGIAVEPGTYTADLRVSHNDPLAQPVGVPVTLTVTPSADFGRLEGVVTGLGYCDADPGPLEAEVLIQASDGSSWTVPTNPGDGSYFRWLLGGTYTVTASAENHLIWMEVVQVTAQQTTIQDFGLRLNESCLSYTPQTFTVTLPVDSQLTQSLTINNDGAGELLWEVHETTRTVGTEVISIPRFTGTLPEDKNPVSFERDPNAPDNTGSSGLPLLNPGLPAYGINLSTDGLYYWPDIDIPGTWNLVGSPAIGSAYAADFAGSDFSTLYVLDNDNYNLYAVDTSNGAKTLIGPSGIATTQTTTGLAWDPTTSTMYASSTDGTTAMLYTLNLSTGAASLVANIVGAPYNIDIAIDGNGQMYGHEIAMDVLIRIDKYTGATTVIGSTGFTANYAQGMDYDLDNDILYLAAYNYTTVGVGEIRVADTNTGATTLVGTIPGGAETDSFAIMGAGEPPWNDVPWVSEVPTNGVLGPDSTFDVDVIFDSTGLTPGECYTATLGLVHDDPGVVTPSYIPLELCVVEVAYGVDLEPEVSSQVGAPGETKTYELQLTNTGNVADTFTVSTSNVEPGWVVSLPVSSFSLAPSESVNVIVTVIIPADALDGDFDTFTVKAVSTSDPTVWNEVEITTTVNIDIFKFFLPLVNKN